MRSYPKLYIDGSWVDPSSDETIDVINASTEDVMGSIPAGTAADVDQAVAAAVAAFGPWSATEPKERVGYVAAIAEAWPPASRTSPRPSPARSACRSSSRS